MDLSSAQPILNQKSHLNPFDYQVYQERFKSFTITNWKSMPVGLSPLACAVKGWKYDKEETLHCDFCNKSWAVILPKKDYEFYKRTEKLLEGKLLTEHRTGCIWKYGLDCPDYFMTGEPTDELKLEEQLLLNCRALSEHKELLDHIKEFNQLKCAEDNVDIIKSFSDRNEVTLESLIIAIHGWKLKKLQPKVAVLECSICSRRLPLWSKSTEEEMFDLKRHLAWCPWIKGIKENGLSLIERMVQHVVAETNRKRKRDSSEYRTSQQRKEEIKEITKFMRRSLPNL